MIFRVVSLSLQFLKNLPQCGQVRTFSASAKSSAVLCLGQRHMDASLLCHASSMLRAWARAVPGNLVTGTTSTESSRSDSSSEPEERK